MMIETKEVVTLTTEETEAINTAYKVMYEIMTETNDPDIYNAVKQACDGLEDFGYLVNTEVK